MHYYEQFLNKFLLEYNKPDLIKRYATKVNQHLNDDHTTIKSMNELLTHIDTELRKNNQLQIIDPYIKWIINLYANYKDNNGNIIGIRFAEDIFGVVNNLLIYDKLKKNKTLPPEYRDINRFNSLSEFRNIINQYSKMKKTLEKNDNIEQEFINTHQVEILLNNDNYEIISPKSEIASKYYGRGTEWCTAYKNNNYFDEYNEQGPLYIILDKKTNERWQFHFESKQYMDEQDEEIDIIEFKEQHPEVINWLVDNVEINDYIFLVQVIDNPSEELQSKAVRQNPYIIQYIKNPSEKIQLEAVRQNINTIQHIKNPTEKVQLIAVRQNGNTIRYIDNPSEQVQLEAVRKNGYAIQYSKNPSEKIQLEAVKNNGFVIQLIKNPSEQVQLEAVKQAGCAIRYIDNPSEKLQLIAVRQDGNAIRYIDNPSEQVQLIAVRQDGNAIEYINNQSEQVQLEAVRKDGNAIRYINNPSEELKLEAVKENGLAIEYIKNPSEQVQLEAVKQNIYAIEYIKNPYSSVITYFNEHK